MNRPVHHMDLLMEMLSIPAISRKEEKRADFLENYLSEQGMQVKRIHNNLLVSLPGHMPVPAGKGKSRHNRAVILLNSHMDTVPPVEGWTTDPFSPKLENGMITGLGSNDAGASLVSLVTVFFELSPRWEGEADLLLLLSAEEEISGSNGFSSVLDQLGKIDAAVVGEPTGMQPAVAERGLMVLDAVVHGKAGHAGRDEGQNAIYLAMKDIDALSGMKFPEKSAWLSAPSARVTMISAGTAHNVIPGSCRYVVDVRSNDKYENEALLKLIRDACKADITPRSTRLRPSSLDPDHPLMKTIHLTGLNPFGSSTLSDMALMPFPAVKMGPGDSSRSHTSGEYILVKEMEDAAQIYIRFLSTLKDVLVKVHPDREVHSGLKNAVK